MLKIDSNFKINLFRNPIKQISWDFSDFVANKNYKPDDFTQFIKRNSIMDAKRFNQYKQFYNFNHNEQEFEDKLLQIFEKFESPQDLCNWIFQVRRSWMKGNGLFKNDN